MKIVVLDGYTLHQGDLSWDEVRGFGEFIKYDRTNPREVVDRGRGAEIILTNKVPISADAIQQLKELRFIAVTATGFNMVDIVTAGRNGIPVSNVPEYGTDSVAQFVFALLLELCHHVGDHNEATKEGEWAMAPDWCFWKSPQVLLKGKKIGIVGFGRIGRRVGELANVFGMEVMAFDPICEQNPNYAFSRCSSLEGLFSESDVVTLHCPQTEDNEGFVDRKLIGAMKSHAFLINTARGGLVNESALADALNSGKITGAAVDVASVEPIRSDNPLLGAKNCLITPHIAWATLGARKRLMAETVKNINAFMSGNPINVVNAHHLFLDRTTG